jgi:hypothetical protein
VRSLSSKSQTAQFLRIGPENQMTEASPIVTTPIAVQKESLLAAYDLVRDEIRAFPDERLMPINIDVPTAVTVGLGTVPEMMALRPTIAKSLPDFDLRNVDKLELYANATLHAHTRWVFATTPPESLQRIAEESAVLRELLVANVQALAKHALVDGKVLKELKGAVGYRNLAVDLSGMAEVLRQSWPSIADKTALTASDLERADRLAQQLVKGVGLKQQAPAVIAETAQERQRAFSLYVRAYDQVRRAASYLRWTENDVDQICPSLYAGRTTAKRKTDSEETDEGSTDVTPADTDAEPAALAEPPAPIGHPNASPFMKS